MTLSQIPHDTAALILAVILAIDLAVLVALILYFRALLRDGR